MSSSTSPTVSLNTGVQMPIVGLGTYKLVGAEDVYQAVDAALTAGYRSFDSAAVYRNEADLGRALRELLPKHGLTRQDVFITRWRAFGEPHSTQHVRHKTVRLGLASAMNVCRWVLLQMWNNQYYFPRCASNWQMLQTRNDVNLKASKQNSSLSLSSVFLIFAAFSLCFLLSFLFIYACVCGTVASKPYRASQWGINTTMEQIKVN